MATPILNKCRDSKAWSNALDLGFSPLAGSRVQISPPACLYERQKGRMPRQRLSFHHRSEIPRLIIAETVFPGLLRLVIAPTGFEPMFAGPKPAVLGLYTTGLLYTLILLNNLCSFKWVSFFVPINSKYFFTSICLVITILLPKTFEG